ncbi:MAG: hypothetical protein KAR38_06035 [Calditrichia bacterium]|nr:hypothetical protein [Calditrichia bacterium]
MKLFFIFLISLIVFISFNCDKNSNLKIQYPLSIGSNWEYQRTMEAIGSSGSVPDFFNNYNAKATVEITSMEFLNDTLETYVFRSVLQDSFGTYISENYYNDDNNGLYIYAYKNATGVVIHPKSNKYSFVLNKKRYNSLQELSYYIQNPFLLTKSNSTKDSIIMENPPVMSLEYPLKNSSHWAYRSEEHVIPIDKKVISKQVIETPAGNFYCYKIQWIYTTDIFDGVEFYDYVGKIGLIKRELHVKNIEITSAEGGTIGTIDILDAYILKNYNIE